MKNMIRILLVSFLVVGFSVGCGGSHDNKSNNGTHTDGNTDGNTNGDSNVAVGTNVDSLVLNKIEDIYGYEIKRTFKLQSTLVEENVVVFDCDGTTKSTRKQGGMSMGAKGNKLRIDSNPHPMIGWEFHYDYDPTGEGSDLIRIIDGKISLGTYDVLNAGYKHTVTSIKKVKKCQ